MRVRGYAPATPCWTVLSCANPDAAAAFYSGLFGWTFDGTDFQLRGLTVAGLMPAAPGSRSAWLTYISTDDLTDTAHQITDAGGTVLQPPFPDGTRGQAALFTDTSGAVFGGWQHGKFAGSQVANESGAICWSEVLTRDVTAATAFYGKVFGWTERLGTAGAHQEYHEWIAMNRVVGGMSRMDEQYPAGTPAHWRTIFLVDDCAATAEAAVALGGILAGGPVDAGVGLGAMLIDPLGAPFLAFELSPDLRAALG